MPISPVTLWSIAREGTGVQARCGAEALVAGSPAALWRAVAARSSGSIVHLAEPGQTAEIAALERAARQMVQSGFDALIGRVRDGDGRLSTRLNQPASLRFLTLAPGTILVTSEALAWAAEAGLDRAFDAFWPHDLANAIARRGLIGGADAVFAHSPGSRPEIEAARMPFARANPLKPRPGSPLILVYGAIEASVSLYFDGLPDDLRAQLRFLKPGNLASDMDWLTEAALVVVVRDFEHMMLTGTLDLLTETGTPFVWFTDDDFVALGAEDAGLAFYSVERVAAFAARAAGIVTTSAALAQSLHRRHQLNVVLWPCIHDAALAAGDPSPRGEGLRIGAFGGAFRRTSFERDVLPAVAALRNDHPVTVIASGAIARRDAHVEPIAFEPDFRAFVLRWRRLGLNALVHPYGETLNITAKSEASLLAAAYIGAVPIVGDEPAYQGLDEAQGVLKAAAGSAAWLARLRSLGDAETRERLYRRLDAWCRTNFAAEKARAPFAMLAGLALADGADGIAARRALAGQSAVVQTALRAPPVRPGLRKRLRRSLSRRWRQWVLRR